MRVLLVELRIKEECVSDSVDRESREKKNGREKL
jgi:hypothetical protein